MKALYIFVCLFVVVQSLYVRKTKQEMCHYDSDSTSSSLAQAGKLPRGPQPNVFDDFPSIHQINGEAALKAFK